MVRRDLIKDVPLIVIEEWYVGSHKEESVRTQKEKDALKISDILINEILSSDYIVIGSPMHNFGISSTLKLYLDQIIRVNKTWTASYKGMLSKQKIYVIITRGGGGYEVGEAMYYMNQQEPYLRAVFGFIGIKEPHFIKLNNLAKGDQIVKEVCEAADKQIEILED